MTYYGINAASAAASAVVQVGKGGRGFILAVGESRYVVTAAHCVFRHRGFIEVYRRRQATLDLTMIGRRR